jgi:transposase
MKCPNCGHEPTKGRPKKIDDAKVRKMRKAGKSLAEISKKFDVTRGAVQASLNRTFIF